MSDTLPLAGRKALVTGASRGLGVEIARRLHAGGAEVALAARDQAALHKLAGELGKAKTFAVDLADAAQVEKFLDDLISQTGGVDIVVNNAAVQGPIGAMEEANFSAWREVFQVNFFAAARICQKLIEPMRGRGWGKIINLSGGGATSPRPDVSAYGVSKCALVRFSETLAVELAGSGIDVNCVSPGAMNTRMLDEVLAAGPSGAAREYEKARQQQKAGGASLAKAAELVAFLASGESDGITGKLISAVWDDWKKLAGHREELGKTDVYTLRRIVPEDRGVKW